ncbi:MAG: N-acetyltransferase [Chromatiales bacterium]|nr:N-acetyltransferase [Chromatiales bacterium]
MIREIRMAHRHDRDAVRAVHLRAFPDGEGEVVAALAKSLLGEDSNPETISLIALADGEIVGHVAFSPVFANPGDSCLGYILAPLAVVPEFHGRGIGSRLVRDGMARLAQSGIDVVLVYGDPGYYGRFGFQAQAAENYLPPHELKFPFGWQAAVPDGRVLVRQPVRLSCVAPLDDPSLW